MGKILSDAIVMDKTHGSSFGWSRAKIHVNSCGDQITMHPKIFMNAIMFQ
jgi:hypothetical protein